MFDNSHRIDYYRKKKDSLIIVFINGLKIYKKENQKSSSIITRAFGDRFGAIFGHSAVLSKDQVQINL